MLRINNIKLKIEHTEEELIEKLLQALKIQKKDLKSYTIRKRSVDARKKDDVKYIYCIDALVNQEGKVCKKAKSPDNCRCFPYDIIICNRSDIKIRTT